jgi:serine O-acetyltransferase
LSSESSRLSDLGRRVRRSQRDPAGAAFRRSLRRRHPRFLRAVAADARFVSGNQGRPIAGDASGMLIAFHALRMAWESDAFLGQCLYRAKARLQGLGVPVLPRICHRLAMAIAQIAIGDPVLVRAGVYLVHGQVVIDGITEIGPGAVIAPFVTVGLTTGDFRGPTIGAGARIGTGARVLGPVVVGEGARVGANAVVLSDVPPAATAVGVPARIVDRGEG